MTAIDTESHVTAADHPDLSAMQEQMHAMQEQMQSIRDVVIEMAAAQHAPLPTEPAAIAESVTTGSRSTSSATLAGNEDVRGDVPTDMASFASVPLGSLVDSTLKSKIWAKQFIDLALLLGDPTSQTTVFLDVDSSSTVVKVKDHNAKKISTVEQWSDAFLVYTAIYTQRHPAEIQDILKYIQIIRNMASASRPGVFLAYDRDFRKLRAHNSMPWSHLHQELHFTVTRHASTLPTASTPLGRSQLPKKQSFPSGYCFVFCTYGTCKNPNCRYQHLCPICRGHHAQSKCPRRAAPTFPNTPAPNAGARPTPPMPIKRK